MAGKNSLDSKTINYNSDALKVCHKSWQFLYLPKKPKNATMLQLTFMQNDLTKP